MASPSSSTRSPFAPGGRPLPPLLRLLSTRLRARQLSLRVRFLVAALLLATLPLLIASVILPRQVQSTLTSLGEAQLTEVANDLADATQHAFAAHLETARSFAAIAPLRAALLHSTERNTPADDALLQQQLHALLRDRNLDFENVFLATPDGISRHGIHRTGRHGQTVDSPLVDISDRAYFIEAALTRRPVVSDPLRSKIGGEPVVIIAVPFLRDDGTFAGVLGLSVQIRPLSERIAAHRIGRTGYPFAIDRTGILVAHPDPRRFFTDALIRVADADRLATRMRAGEAGIESYISSLGEHKLAAFAPVPICGWSIAASQQTAEFAAPAQQLRRIIFAMIGACLLIALVVAAVFAVGLEQLKLALAEARASEARFKLFARVASGAIWDWDLATDELWWNDGLADTFGCPPAGIPNYSALRQRIPEGERDLVSVGLRACISDGTWSGEHHFRREDGTFAYVLHRAFAVRGPDGHVVRVIGGLTDISERRAIERKLAEQAALLDQTRDGILVKDLDQIIRFWNAGAAQLYGWTAVEAVGRRADELLQFDSAAFEAAAHAVLQHGQWFGQLQAVTKAGAVRTLDCRWTLLRDEDQRPKSILAIDTDITERLQMEARFLRAQRLESIGTLAGGIAHDLNNLLCPILMGVDVLKSSPLAEPEAKIIGCIEQSAHRGSNLVKQVLSFARGEEGARVSVHLGYVIREVEAIVRSTFPKNLRLQVEIQKTLPLVRADPTQLNQVLVNLCVNARDAMPAGGTLRISAREFVVDAGLAERNRELNPGLHVLLEVSDTGTGMSREVLEKIFEPFFTTKAPGKGTGLGLSTVIGIVRSHGGAVNVYSELGQGSVFKILLPATADAADAPAAEAAPLPHGHGELILLVDDEPAILNLAKRSLETFGYQVLLATDGAHAFALYHRHRADIDLILTDMMMPLMDGLALIAALRRVDPAIVVIGASGLNDHNNQIKAADAGIKHFLCKPYTAAALLGIVRTALDERAARREPPTA